jgi:hypothetical protein
VFVLVEQVQELVQELALVLVGQVQELAHLAKNLEYLLL